MKTKIMGVVMLMGCLFSSAALAEGAEGNRTTLEQGKAYHQGQALRRYVARTDERAAATATQAHLENVGAFIKANPEVHRAYLASRQHGQTLDQAQQTHSAFVGSFIEAARARILANPSDAKANQNYRRMAYTVSDLPSPWAKGSAPGAHVSSPSQSRPPTAARSLGASPPNRTGSGGLSMGAPSRSPMASLRR